jgi:hypothetical protein
MDILLIPAIGLFTGMIASFATVLLFVTIGDAVKT